MKWLIGATAMLGAALYFTRIAGKFGVPEDTAKLIVYMVLALWILALVATLVRWIINKRRLAAKNAAPVDPAVLAQKARNAELRACLKQVRAHQRRTAAPRPFLSTPFTPPWFAVIGLPGHGKTALLGPTGAKTIVEVDRDGVRTAAPETPPDDRPRLFSAPGSAVYLEVPHGLARTDAMRPAWLAVLKQLKGRSQPLHGIIVVVGIDDLAIANDPNHAAQVGEDLGRELADLGQQLAIRVPVYLVISKIDRLAGFHDLLGNADPRGQALGFELPDGRSDDLILKEMRTRFDALCTALDRRALRSVSRYPEPDHTVQPRLITFPRQLAELTDDLAALTKSLIATRNGETPRLRGVYFTSASQGGEPSVAPIMEHLLRNAGGGSYNPDQDRPAQSRRYFIDELMTTTWHRGAVLATLTPRVRTRKAISRGVLAGAGILLAAHVGFTGTTVAENNRKLAQDTVDVSGRLVTQLGGERRVPLAPADLEALGQLLIAWDDPAGVDEADVRGWGLFSGDAVSPPLRKFFRRAMFRGVLEPLHKRTAAELQDFLARYESPDRLPELQDWLSGHDALRFYLLLSGPKVDSENRPIRDDRLVFVNEVRKRWVESARAAVDPRQHVKMEAIANQYVDLAEDADFALSRDPALIESIREILLREIPENAEVDEVIDLVSGKPEVPKISLRALAGVPSIENDSTDVRGAFTEVGWSYVKSEFATLQRGVPWVLGLGDARAKEIQQKRGRNLRSIYFDAYIKEWTRFVNRIRIVSPTNLDRAKDIYGEVMRGRPNQPLKKVFLKLQENVTLKDDFNYGDTGLAIFQDRAKVSGSVVRAGDVAKAFQPMLNFTVAPAGKDAEVPLDQYHVHMRTLHDGVSKALENKEEEKALIDALKSAIDDTESLIANGSLDEWQKDTTELLITPLKDLLKLLERESGEGAKGDWCARIVEPMYDRFAGRYPIDPESRDEIALADFEEFFHPENGEIRKAREALLSGWVTKEGNYYVSRDLGKGDVSRIDPQVVKFLNRAADIGMVMFVSEELRVDFDVVLVCNPQVSRVEFKVAGELREFTCDSKQLPRLRWPNKDAGASLFVKGRQTKKNLDEPGEWGLFKLLERWSKLPDGSGDVLDFVFDLSQYDLGSLEVRLKPIRSRGGTAFFGLSNGDRKYLSLIRASDVLPPKRLFTNRGGC